MLCEKSVLRNFVKFTGKQLCQSLYAKTFYMSDAKKHFFCPECFDYVNH